MVEPPKGLEWLLPERKKWINVRRYSFSYRAGVNTRTPRPDKEAVYEIASEMGLLRDDALERAVDLLYKRSDTPTPYGFGIFSIFKTTHIVKEKLGNPGFNHRVKYKHLEWALKTAYGILKEHPDIGTLDEYPDDEKYLSGDEFFDTHRRKMFGRVDARGKLRIIMDTIARKEKAERISALLSEGKTRGYWQHNAGFNSDLKRLLREYGGRLFDDEAKDILLRLDATSSRSEFMFRLSDCIEMDVFPTIGVADNTLDDAWILMERRLYHDLFDIYRDKLRARKAGTCADAVVNKADVERALRRRYGLVLAKGETFDQLVPEAEGLNEW